jgi:hypothetical protein
LGTTGVAPGGASRAAGDIADDPVGLAESQNLQRRTTTPIIEADRPNTLASAAGLAWCSSRARTIRGSTYRIVRSGLVRDRIERSRSSASPSSWRRGTHL